MDHNSRKFSLPSAYHAGSVIVVAAGAALRVAGSAGRRAIEAVHGTVGVDLAVLVGAAL